MLIFGAATILFTIAGVIVAGWSLYRLIKKDYYDPMMDGDSQNDDLQNNDSQ